MTFARWTWRGVAAFFFVFVCAGAEVRNFQVTGLVREVAADGRTVLIDHDRIPGYMEPMSMRFKVRTPAELKSLRAGDKISFTLAVTESESWISGLQKSSEVAVAPSVKFESERPNLAPATRPRDLVFTNELGQAVRLRDFPGQAMALTFFFTRCPVPEYCPRLSRNFSEATRKLMERPGGPTNWQFFSITFDPSFDTPAVLKAYGERYQQDPGHWHFLRGSEESTAALASLFGLHYVKDAGLYNHDFRTVVIDAAGAVQMVYPVSGDLTDSLVTEVVKAAGKTGQKGR